MATEYTDILYELLTEKEENGLIGQTEIYCGMTVFRDLEYTGFISGHESEYYTVPTDVKLNVGIEQESDPSLDQTSEIDGLSRYKIVRQSDYFYIEDPNLGKKEIMIVHTPSVEKTGGPPTVKNTDAIQKVNLYEPEATDPKEYKQCALPECEKRDSIMVEGNNNDMFCSIEHLNEAYNP